MVKAVNLVPFRELPVELLLVAIFKKGKFGSLKTVFHVIGLFEPSIHQFLCSKCAPRSITGDNKQVVCFFENFAYLLCKCLILNINATS